MLARREHSRVELAAKLLRKFPSQESDIEDVLERLQVQGLQSDERFVAAWLRSQVLKGRGPRRIALEARGKGIDSLLEDAMVEANVDWFALASEVAARKFRNRGDLHNQAKIYRFLSYRGFSNDMIHYAIEELSE